MSKRFRLPLLHGYENGSGALPHAAIHVERLEGQPPQPQATLRMKPFLAAECPGRLPVKPGVARTQLSHHQSERVSVHNSGYAFSEQVCHRC